MEKLYTVNEASEISRMSVAWWRMAIFQKKVRYVKIGSRVLIPETTLKDLINTSVVEPIPAKERV